MVFQVVKSPETPPYPSIIFSFPHFSFLEQLKNPHSVVIGMGAKFECERTNFHFFPYLHNYALCKNFLM